MEVLTTTEMERADRLTIAAGTPGFALMMSAGQAVAEAAMALVEEGPIVVVAGRGNNGGDGFVAAAELAARGRDVSVILLCERDSLQGDAALAARGWKYPVLPFNPQAIGKPALIIDALFGAGLNRPVKGDPLEMIEAINANGAPVLAVDLPSGINGTTGAVMGAAINAVETVTFFRRKPAHLLMPGRKHCGRVRVADIGIDSRRARRDPAAYVRERAAELAKILPGAWHRRPQIRPRPCRRAVRRPGFHRRGAARGARRAAGRGRARDGGLAARCAGGQCRGADGGDGSRRRYAGRIRRDARRQAAQFLRDRAGRRRQRAHARFRPHGAVGETRPRARCRRADEFCRGAGAVV